MLLDVDLEWDVRIPMRDGTQLSAVLYRPAGLKEPVPTLFAMTPYVASNHHEQGIYFAKHGYVFLCVDIRGRGNSDGEFHPLRDADDGHDVVEWLARQSFCNGKVAMWGSSYLAYTQWATASRLPPHLATIVPAAPAYFGVDVPIRNNVFSRFMIRWLTSTAGRTLQNQIIWDTEYWNRKFRQTHEAGIALTEFDRAVKGNRTELYQEWLTHPHRDEYWDRHSPSAEQLSALSIPILTITGIYDDDQPGALEHYRAYMRHAAPERRALHYLIIGPWDHFGTVKPRLEFGGLKVGPASQLDLPALHLQWYAWTMRGGPKPEFLKNQVAYYVPGAEEWRYSETLEAVTARHLPMYLSSTANPIDPYHSGSLVDAPSQVSSVDHYVYDPRDVRLAQIESTLDPELLVSTPLVNAATGHQLVYHGPVLENSLEICGVFRLSLWLAIDQPDTDIRAAVYEVALDGSTVLLSTDWVRARYRKSPRVPQLVDTTEPLRYDFERFTFTARRLSPGSRLRLVVGPLDSIHWGRNYNAGGDTAKESMSDARVVTVRVFHDQEHRSALHVPCGA